ncbi:MAG: hypothetical protein U1E76_16080 [Planctomycetota bacterium]
MMSMRHDESGASVDLVGAEMSTKTKHEHVDFGVTMGRPRKVSPIAGFRRTDRYRKIKPVVDLGELMELTPKTA